jgi:putative transposase
LGVDLEGKKEVLALCACAEENKDGWLNVLQDMRRRGATQVHLLVTDGHDGLLAATDEVFSATPRQRCLVHKLRNVMSAILRREREGVQADLTGNGRAREEGGCADQPAGVQSQTYAALP